MKAVVKFSHSLLFSLQHQFKDILNAMLLVLSTQIIIKKLRVQVGILSCGGFWWIKLKFRPLTMFCPPKLLFFD